MQRRETATGMRVCGCCSSSQTVDDRTLPRVLDDAGLAAAAADSWHGCRAGLHTERFPPWPSTYEKS
jgi:hypothetical protein